MMPWIKRCALSLLVFVSIGVSSSGAIDPLLTRRSDRFVVHDVRPAAYQRSQFASEDGRSLIRIEPDQLMVCAERTAERLAGILGIPARGGVKLHMMLYSAFSPEDPITIRSTVEPGGWRYRVDVPDPVDPVRLVRGVTQALLQEFANRHAGSKSAEIPLWFVEGLTMHLFAATGPDLIVESAPLGLGRGKLHVSRSIREPRGVDSLRAARELLHMSPALSFAQLSEPSPEWLTGHGLRIYQASAQLFMYELLRTPGGAGRITRMLQELPHCWNWEFAFLRSHADQFHRLLDVEKWWSVRALGIATPGSGVVWPLDLSLLKLNEVLSTRAQVWRRANELPQLESFSLQNLVTEWDYATQRTALIQKNSQLVRLRLFVPRKMLDVLDAYVEAISEYIERRDLSANAPTTRMQRPASPRAMVAQIITRLNLLDRTRDALLSENRALSAQAQR